jgi:hypothetical protein
MNKNKRKRSLPQPTHYPAPLPGPPRARFPSLGLPAAHSNSVGLAPHPHLLGLLRPSPPPPRGPAPCIPGLGSQLPQPARGPALPPPLAQSRSRVALRAGTLARAAAQAVFPPRPTPLRWPARVLVVWPAQLPRAPQPCAPSRSSVRRPRSPCSCRRRRACGRGWDARMRVVHWPAGPGARPSRGLFQAFPCIFQKLPPPRRACPRPRAETALRMLNALTERPWRLGYNTHFVIARNNTNRENNFSVCEFNLCASSHVYTLGINK